MRNIEEKKEIESILNQHDYDQIESLLKEQGDVVLNILYQKTEEERIDLETEEGSQIWRYVIKFYSDRNDKKKIDLVFSRLAECSRMKFLKGLDNFVYGLLFTIYGGASFSIDGGYWLADKFGDYKTKKKLQEILQG